VDLGTPLSEEPRRGHHQRRLGLAAERQHAQRRQRLDRLAQSHVVGQEQHVTPQQLADGCELVGEQRPRPLQRPVGSQQQLGRRLQQHGQALRQRHLAGRALADQRVGAGRSGAGRGAERCLLAGEQPDQADAALDRRVLVGQ